MWWVLVPRTSGLFSSTATYFYMVPSLKNRINFRIVTVRIYQILSAYTSEFSDLKFALRYPVQFLKESQFLICLYIKNAVVLHCTYFVELFGGALEMYCFFYVHASKIFPDLCCTASEWGWVTDNNREMSNWAWIPSKLEGITFIIYLLYHYHF